MINSNAPVTFLFSGLPSPYCFTTPEKLALDITAGLYGYLPGNYSTFIDSESEPSASDRDKLWFKREVGGAPTGRLYAYYNGNWVMPNPEAAGGYARRIFRGTPEQIWAYDGGDGTDPAINPPTSAAGAMWVIDTDFGGRFPIGVGTVQPSGTVVAQGDTGGADQHTLTVDEMPEHNHPPLVSGHNFCTYTPDNTGVNDGNLGNDFIGAATTGNTGGSDPHSILNPYLGVYFIRRSNRVFYVA